METTRNGVRILPVICHKWLGSTGTPKRQDLAKTCSEVHENMQSLFTFYLPFLPLFT